MGWKIKLCIVCLVLFGYFNYVSTNIPRALAGIEQLRTLYAAGIDQADTIAAQTDLR